MARVPNNPKIYHITHVDNLPAILRDGAIWSDAQRVTSGLGCTLVGMSHIKKRRLTEIEVACHPGTYVGQYAPFYLCPRSIMLYILHKGNHPDITYTGGQGPIVHLEADLKECAGHAEVEGIPWACTTRNASIKYEPGMFFNRIDELNRLDWAAIETSSWSDPQIKDRKQAEFLMYDSFPWHLVRRIGVCDQRRKAEVEKILAGVRQAPEVVTRRGWYY